MKQIIITSSNKNYSIAFSDREALVEALRKLFPDWEVDPPIKTDSDFSEFIKIQKMISQTTQKDNPRIIKYIVVHCTATRPDAKIENIQNYWKNTLKWKNPGYHYIVKADGTIINLHPETLSSNGVKGFNSTALNISYIGGVDHKGNAKDTRTTHQKNALAVALKILKSKYPGALIWGHHDFPGVAKACPSFNAKEEYKHL